MNASLSIAATVVLLLGACSTRGGECPKQVRHVDSSLFSDTRPVTISRTPPRAPRILHPPNEVTVAIRHDILPDGSIADATVVSNSSKFVEFGEMALEALATWKFEPQVFNDCPVRRENYVTTLIFRFE